MTGLPYRLVACCKCRVGKRIWSIAREMMRPYYIIHGWLVGMVHRGLDGRFDRKLTGQKNILGPGILKKITEWVR